MKKIKKVIISLIFLLLFIILGNKSDAASNLYLNNLKFDTKILENGDMEVTETWNINIKDTNTLFKTFKTDEKKYTGIKDVKVEEITNGINKDFTETSKLMYHVTKDCYYGLINNDNNFEIAWGVGLDDGSDTRVYEISYLVEGAVSSYSDYNELYWQFVGEDFEIDAKNIVGTITLPSKVENKDELRVWGHTQGLNGEIYATDLDKIEFTINNFKSGVYVEIRTLFPKYVLNNNITRTYNYSILNTVLEEEKVWAEEANRLRDQKKLYEIGVYIAVALISILLFLNIIRKIKVIRNRKINKPTEDIIYFRETPRKDASPGEAIYLLRKTKTDIQPNDIGKIFSATLLKFALEKYIEIEVQNNGHKKEDIYINLLNQDRLTNLENKDEKTIGKFLISAFEKNKTTKITVKELEGFIKKTSSVKLLNMQEDIRNSVKDKLIDIKLIDEKNKKQYEKESIEQVFSVVATFVFGMLVFMLTMEVIGKIAISLIPIVMAIINIVVTGIALYKINVFTKEGLNECEKWKGLKKYMEEFSLLNEKEIPEIAIWEEFLVYATAFGIADKVLKQLKIVYPDIDNNINISTYPYMYLMIHTDFSNSFSNAISSSMSSAYSSTSGGGGGFSGGGRRWPVAGGGGGGR